MTAPVTKTAQKRKVGDGTPGPGRPAGVPNKTTTLLREAILLAAEAVGEDGEGKNGLLGYLSVLARSEPKSFAMLLGKVLPLQVTGADGGPIEIVTKEQRDAAVAAALRADQ